MRKRKDVCVVCGGPGLIGYANKFCSRKHQLIYRDERESKNKDKLCAAQKQYREKNKDKLCAAQKQYYEKNKDKIKQCSMAWRERHPYEYAAYQAKYRAEHAGLKQKTRWIYG